MNNYLLLFSIGVIPALAGIIATRPLWKLKYLRNEDIHFIGIVTMIGFVLFLLIFTVLRTAFTSDWIIGLLCAPASLVNMPVFDWYDLRLHIRRCPYCHRQALHIRAKNNGHYRLRCHSCGIHTEWKR